MQKVIKNAAKVIAKAVTQYTGSKFALGRAQEITARLYGFKDYASATYWLSPEGAQASMLDVERAHARGAGAGSYENEFILPTASGRSIHAPAYPDECTYVRVVDQAGNELMYWDSAEWAESPEEVMGAILGALKGTGRSDLPVFTPLTTDIPFVDTEAQAPQVTNSASNINLDLVIGILLNGDQYSIELHKSWPAVWAPVGDPNRLKDDEIAIWLNADEPGFLFRDELTARDLRSLVWDSNHGVFVLKREDGTDFIEFWEDAKAKP